MRCFTSHKRFEYLPDLPQTKTRRSPLNLRADSLLAKPHVRLPDLRNQLKMRIVLGPRVDVVELVLLLGPAHVLREVIRVPDGGLRQAVQLAEGRGGARAAVEAVEGQRRRPLLLRGVAAFRGVEVYVPRVDSEAVEGQHRRLDEGGDLVDPGGGGADLLGCGVRVGCGGARLLELLHEHVGFGLAHFSEAGLRLVGDGALVERRGGVIREEVIDLFVEGGHGLFFALGLILGLELTLLICELRRGAHLLALLAR